MTLCSFNNSQKIESMIYLEQIYDIDVYKQGGSICSPL